jgi:Leucine-rich repeat (LRR) protein
MNDDIIFELYKFLHLTDIIKCSLINKQFNRVTKNELLWKENIKEVIKFDGSYYESFKFNYGLERIKKWGGYKNDIKKLYHQEYLGICRTMKFLPSQIGLLQNLQKLSLTHSGIKIVSPSIGLLQNLKILNLEHNLLETLPTQIGLMKNLQEIFLGYNLLTSIPSEMGNLYNLQTLGLSGNKLKTLPTELGKPITLKEIFIREMDIIVPDEIYQIPYIFIQIEPM